jgi:hypothetical protein
MTNADLVSRLCHNDCEAGSCHATAAHRNEPVGHYLTVVLDMLGKYVRAELDSILDLAGVTDADDVSWLLVCDADNQHAASCIAKLATSSANVIVGVVLGIPSRMPHG